MTEEEIHAITLATTPVIGVYVAIIALALVAPEVAAFGYLVVAVLAVLRSRGDSTQEDSTANERTRL